MALIFFISSRPAAEAAKAVPMFFGIKFVHIVEYGILFYLLRFAVTKTANLRSREIFMVSIMLTTLYGLSDELHQSFASVYYCFL